MRSSRTTMSKSGPVAWKRSPKRIDWMAKCVPLGSPSSSAAALAARLVRKTASSPVDGRPASIPLAPSWMR